MGDITPLPDSQPELKSTDSPAAELDITMDDSVFLDDDDTTHSTWATSNVDISALNTALSLLSLNGNSFFKVSNPSSRHHLIRYIRSKSPTFVALQEIDQSSDSFQHQNILHQQFCCQQSLWTEYCGLLCFDPQFTLSRIPLPEDSRCILAKTSHGI
ncbi:hypothetical protein G6F43_013355 [Rhizopus delemar]|nr:hypothetical protein G6F43_013355 [Rhizopus delemar]